MIPRTLHLVRHGATALSGTGRIVGVRLDPDLGSKGEAQAEAAAASLADRPLVAVLTSPLLRARRTAEAVAARHRLAVELEPDLRELDFGEAEGLTFAEVERAWPAVARAWADRPAEVRFPGGEDFLALTARVTAAVERATARLPRGELALVTHAGPIRALLGRARGLSADAALRLPCDPGSSHTLAWP